MQFSVASCSFIPFTSKYSSQHPVLKQVVSRSGLKNILKNGKIVYMFLLCNNNFAAVFVGVLFTCGFVLR
jgi:hypothetical protein